RRGGGDGPAARGTAASGPRIGLLRRQHSFHQRYCRLIVPCWPRRFPKPRHVPVSSYRLVLDRGDSFFCAASCLLTFRVVGSDQRLLRFTVSRVAAVALQNLCFLCFPGPTRCKVFCFVRGCFGPGKPAYRVIGVSDDERCLFPLSRLGRAASRSIGRAAQPETRRCSLRGLKGRGTMRGGRSPEAQTGNRVHELFGPVHHPAVAWHRENGCPSAPLPSLPRRRRSTAMRWETGTG